MHHCTIAGLAVSLLLFSQMGLAQSSFEITDDNNDGRINKEEFYERIKKANVFSAVDTNADRRIDEDEFEQVDIPGLFADWDVEQDGFLTWREFYNGIYRYIDADSDGTLSVFEWDDPGEEGWFGTTDEFL